MSEQATKYLKLLIDEIQPILSKYPEIHMLIMIALKNKNNKFETRVAHNMTRRDLIRSLEHELFLLRSKEEGYLQ